MPEGAANSRGARAAHSWLVTQARRKDTMVKFGWAEADVVELDLNAVDR